MTLAYPLAVDPDAFLLQLSENAGLLNSLSFLWCQRPLCGLILCSAVNTYPQATSYRQGPSHCLLLAVYARALPYSCCCPLLQGMMALPAPTRQQMLDPSSASSFCASSVCRRS